MKSIILVEDLNDKAIFEAILQYMSLQESINIGIIVPEENKIEFKKLEGTDSNPTKPTSLITALKGLKNNFNKEPFDKVGIILDMDKHEKSERMLMVNTAIHNAFNVPVNSLNDINEFVEIVIDDETTIKFACHFINIGGKGEIEDLLKAIKAKQSSFADCLEEGWKECFEKKGKTLSEEQNSDIKPKEMVKFWVDVYKRFDILPSKNKRNQVNTSWEGFMKNNSDAFDFGKDGVNELKELKEFLRSFIPPLPPLAS